MLEVRDLHAGYGRVPVLHAVSLDGAARRGRARAGSATAPASRRCCEHRRIHPADARHGQAEGPRHHRAVARDQRAPMDLRLILDGHRVFPELSVADNIRLGAAIRDERRRSKRWPVRCSMSFRSCASKLRSPARDLSAAASSRCSRSRRPSWQGRTVLLCDEPSLGLAQALIPPILEFLKDWARAGVGVLIVEQQIDLALSVADRALVLERGAITLEGSAQALQQDAARAGDLPRYGKAHEVTTEAGFRPRNRTPATGCATRRAARRRAASSGRCAARLRRSTRSPRERSPACHAARRRRSRATR